jgi:hypothetical protein
VSDWWTARVARAAREGFGNNNAETRRERERGSMFLSTAIKRYCESRLFLLASEREWQ